MYEVRNSEDLGRVITFWGPIHRQCAVSTTVALTACYIASQLKDDKLLLMSNEIHGSPTAADYMVKDDMPDGLTEVVELASCESLKGYDDIYNNTYSAIPNIDILNSNKRTNGLSSAQLANQIDNIFNKAREGYKYILVDAIAGRHDVSTLALLRNSDVIVVCMPQDQYILDSWVRKMSNVYIPEAETKPSIIVIEQYIDYKHLGYGKICNMLNLQDLVYVDMNDTIHKAVCNRNIPDMIMQELKSKSSDVIPELKHLYEYILTGVEVVLEEEKRKQDEEDELNKQQTQEYIDNIGLFDSMGYEETDEEESRQDKEAEEKTEIEVDGIGNNSETLDKGIDDTETSIFNKSSYDEPEAETEEETEVENVFSITKENDTDGEEEVNEKKEEVSSIFNMSTD